MEHVLDIFHMTYVKNTTVDKQKETEKDTMFTKIKVILEEKW